MENIICEAFWGIGDRELTIMVLLHAVRGSMLGIFFMTKFKAKKIVVLEYKYNIINYLNFYSTSTLSCFYPPKLGYPTLSV